MNNNYPASLVKERSGLKTKGGALKQKVHTLLLEAQQLLKKRPDDAHAKVAQAQALVQTFKGELGALEEKKKTFDLARTAYPETLANAEREIKNVGVYLAQLKEREYTVDAEKTLAGARLQMSMAHNILNAKDDVPDFGSVVLSANGAKAQALQVKGAWQKRLALQQENVRKLAELNEWHQTVVPKLLLKYGTDGERLKTGTPHDVWHPVLEETSKKDLALRAQAPPMLQEAARLNAMATQDFEKASKVLENLQALKRDAETLYARPETTLRQYIEAQQQAKNLSTQITGAITQAESALRDPDAQGHGRTQLQEAQAKIAEAEKLKKSEMPNWIMIAALLAGAAALAQTAERSAKNRVNEVEAARKRRREEEERHRREEEAAAHRRRMAAMSSSSSSSSHHSSGHSFGGGSFGGGGASGRF